MEYKKFNNKYLIRIDKGEEIVDTLNKFCQKEKIKLGSINGLGATNNIELGLFDVGKKKYFSQKFKGNFEICPLHGNITTMDGEIYLHLHANIADEKQKSFGGHLNSAMVSATFEAVIDIFKGEIDREFNKEVGLNLLKFNKGEEP